MFGLPTATRPIAAPTARGRFHGVADRLKPLRGPCESYGDVIFRNPDPWALSRSASGRNSIPLLEQFNHPDLKPAPKARHSGAGSAGRSRARSGFRESRSQSLLGGFIREELRCRLFLGNKTSGTARLEYSHRILNEPPCSPLESPSSSRNSPREILKNAIRGRCWDFLNRFYELPAKPLQLSDSCR